MKEEIQINEQRALDLLMGVHTVYINLHQKMPEDNQMDNASVPLKYSTFKRKKVPFNFDWWFITEGRIKNKKTILFPQYGLPVFVKDKDGNDVVQEKGMLGEYRYFSVALKDGKIIFKGAMNNILRMFYGVQPQFTPETITLQGSTIKFTDHLKKVMKKNRMKRRIMFWKKFD